MDGQNLAEEPLLTSEQLAKRLQKDAGAVSRAAKAGTIPAYRIGREWRFKWAEVLASMEKAAEPVKQEAASC